MRSSRGSISRLIFSAVLPVVSDVYLPYRYPLADILIAPLFLTQAGLLMLAALFLRGKGAGFALSVPVLAGAGFLATYVIQSKDWVNHAYPAIALATLGFCLALARLPDLETVKAKAGLFVLPIVILGLPVLLGARLCLPDYEQYPGLRAAINELAPPHPKLAIIANRLDIGHPVAREVGAHWIGRQNCLWTAMAVQYILKTLDASHPDPAYIARLEAYRRADVVALAEDIRTGEPDVILVQQAPLSDWVRAQPEFAGVLPPYCERRRIGEIAIWTRGTCSAASSSHPVEKDSSP
jgi:hypothetical protein